MMRGRPMVSALLGLDAAAILVFVVVGRRSHEEAATFGALASTAAPFLLALAGSSLITRAWRRPAELRTGAALVAGTVAGGMLLRRFVFGDGTAASFVVVATAFLAATMLGWRALAIRAGIRTRPTGP